MLGYLKNLYQNKNSRYTFCIFLVFFIFILAQYQVVVPYYDDYAYYSLTYGGSNFHTGNTFTFTELLAFLKEHYFSANGRLLYFFVWLFMYCLGGLTLVRLTCALILTSILVLEYKLICMYNQTVHKPLVALLLVVCYGLISVSVHRQGTYWFAAFFLYTTPIIPLLIYCLLYKKLKSNTSMLTVITSGVLLFLFSFSQEQLSVAATGTAIIFLLINTIYRKQYWIRHLYYSLCSAMGTMILFCSPAIHQRAMTGNNSGFAELSITEKIMHNYPIVLKLFFMRENILFIIFVLVVGCTLSYTLFMLETKKKKFYLISLLYELIFCVVWYLGLQNIVLETVWIILFAVQLIFYFKNQGKDCYFYIFSVLFLSYACLVVVAELPFRLVIPGSLLLSIFCADILNTTMNVVADKNYLKSLLVCSVILVTVISINNSFHIWRGYAENYVVHQYNDEILSNKNNQDADKIYLRKVPDILYGCEMVYYDGFGYMKKWMDDYYGISYETEYVFE